MLILILSVLSALPLFAETYTDTEFIVEGRPAAPQPGGTTVITATPGYSTTVVQQGPAVVTTAPAESPIYVGMSKYLLVEAMGQPTAVDKFRKFAARHQGIYDEVWTYQTPTGVTYVYIKERRVDKVEYR